MASHYKLSSIYIKKMEENTLKQMTKRCSYFIIVVLVIVFSGGFAIADSSYKNSRWASSLENGTLKIQGPGYGKWGKNWITLNSGVSNYSEIGTSQGPVIIYQKGNSWYGVILRFDTGFKQNPRSWGQPTSIVRGGRYGAIIKSGQKCFDYSWNQLKPVPCQ